MTRAEVLKMAAQSAEQAITAGNNGHYEKAQRLFATAERLRKHARTFDVDAPLGAAFQPSASPASPGGSVSGPNAAPNGDPTP